MTATVCDGQVGIWGKLKRNRKISRSNSLDSGSHTRAHEAQRQQKECKRHSNYLKYRHRALSLIDCVPETTVSPWLKYT